jgi:hypothetical protein
MVELGAGAKAGDQAADSEGGTAIGLQRGIGDAGAVSDVELGDDVRLIGDAGRAAVAFKQPQGGALPDVDDGSRVCGGGVRPRREVGDLERPCGEGARGHGDDHAAGHERRIEGEHRVLGILEQAAHTGRVAGEHIGQVLDRYAIEAHQV